MTNDDHDPIVTRALRDMPVPEHLPGFWDALDQRLAEEAGDDAADVLARSPEDIRVSTAELPAVIDLRPPPQRQPSPNRHRFLAVAAAVAVLAITAGVVLRGDGDGEQQATPTTSAPLASTSEDAPGPPPPSTAVSTESPEAAVESWVQALRDEDIATAASLIGPNSTRYINALGEDLESYMRGTAEDFGPWSTEQPVATRTVEIPGVTTVVVLDALDPSDRGQTFRRIDAIPTSLDAVSGQWLVEPAWFSTDVDSGIDLLAPEDDAPLEPTGGFEVHSPAATDYWFVLDDLPPQEERTGSWTPSEPMTIGPHRMVVVAVGPDLVTTFTRPFEVES